MIQNRTTIVISSQPASSKWWCSGAIRKTRLPVPVRIRVNLNQPTWMITDSVIDDEQAAEDDEQQLGAGEDRQAGEQRRRGPASRCRP